MPATILTLADALVLEFTNRLFLAGVTNTTVERQYEITRDLGIFDGRCIDIFPMMYNPDPNEATRSEEYYDFRYSFVIMRRYASKGVIDKSWIDNEVNFVEEYIFNPLDQRVITIADGIQYWSTEVEVTSVFDFDFLRQNKVFWSEVETVFRKVDTEV